jgi:hypothetical protein
MFRWYKDATICYAYLSDDMGDGSLELHSTLGQSRWFRRGWTLQESAKHYLSCNYSGLYLTAFCLRSWGKRIGQCAGLLSWQRGLARFHQNSQQRSPKLPGVARSRQSFQGMGIGISTHGAAALGEVPTEEWVPDRPKRSHWRWQANWRSPQV